MSSTPLNFGYPGDSLIFRRKIAFLFFLRGSVSTAPKCSIAFEALLAAVLSVLPGGGVSRDHEYMCHDVAVGIWCFLGTPQIHSA